MGSVAFAGEDESQPSTSNCKSYKLPTTILDGCGAVNHASIPRKLRSSIKKRGRESIASPLLISRKQHHVSTAVDTLRKDGAVKSKLNKKQRRITKDEEEVAETLYALAGMFSDANKADQQKIDDEKQEIKSSAALEEDTYPTLQEENTKISSKVTLGAVCPSNVVNSTAEEVLSQTLEARQPELFFSSKQAVAPDASRDQSDLTLVSTSRPLVSILGMNQSGEQEIHLDRVAASGFEHGKNQYTDLFPSRNLSATRGTSSEAHKSCLGARIRLFEGMTFPSQPLVVENKISTEKYARVAAESNQLWKRCSAHVYISRLIKVLQLSDRKEGLSVKPTQPTTCRGAELQPHVCKDNQMLRINGKNSDAYFSAINIVAAKKDSSQTRDQQMASETSAKQGYDFLSLGTGLCGLDTGEGSSGAGCFLEPPKQYHMPYMQSRNQSIVLSLLPRNGYSSSSHTHNSASAPQQVQLFPYHSSHFTGRPEQQMDVQQQKWATQLQMHYNTGGGGEARLPDWRTGAVVNYAHSLFPNMHVALGSKYQQPSPSQQQVMVMSASLPKKRRHDFPLGFERNGGVFSPENVVQLQLPCNQHL